MTAQVLEELGRKLEALERERRGAAQDRPFRAGVEVHSTGLRVLDELLPYHGFRRGSLVEWLAAEQGVGAEWLALRAAGEVCRADPSAGRCLVVDPRGDFYPLAVQGLGLEPRDLILVRPKNPKEELWAYDQALRSGGVAVVLGWIERLADTPFRRLQLAAEKSGCMGFLIRPAPVQSQPSWAEVRLLVQSVSANRPQTRSIPFHLLPRQQVAARPGRRFRLQVLRCPGGKVSAIKEICVDEETGALRLVPPLADPAPFFRQAGA